VKYKVYSFENGFFFLEVFMYPVCYLTDTLRGLPSLARKMH